MATGIVTQNEWQRKSAKARAAATEAQKRAESATRAEIVTLRATIIEADSAFNLDGHVSAWEETAGLVRMCHEGRHALDECARHNRTELATQAAGPITAQKIAALQFPATAATIARTIHLAAAAIGQEDPTCWNDWILLLLQELEGRNSGGYDFDGILMRLRNDVDDRLDNEIW